jgi:hypothetical protein
MKATNVKKPPMPTLHDLQMNHGSVDGLPRLVHLTACSAIKMLYKAIQKTKTSHLIMMFTKNSSFSDRDQRLGLAEPLVPVTSAAVPTNSPSSSDIADYKHDKCAKCAEIPAAVTVPDQRRSRDRKRSSDRSDESRAIGCTVAAEVRSRARQQ